MRRNHMTIIVISKLPENLQQQLIQHFPEQTFIFSQDVETIKANLEQAEVIVGSGSQVLEDYIKLAPNLKWIMSFSAGVDKLPQKLIAERGIMVTNARGVYKKPMAEYTISMLLQVYRREKTLIKNENNRIWEQISGIQEISGRTMVIVGAGAIGQEIARLAKAFDITTYGVSRSGQKREYFDENVSIKELDQVLPKADFVVSVLPGTEETNNLFTKKQFEIMKQEAVFVNIGRGNSVNEQDLLTAIQEKQIAHVILDVFKEEPLPSDHPFWEEENITITPHLSAASPRNRERIFNVFTQNLEKFIKGDEALINQVDILRGY